MEALIVAVMLVLMVGLAVWAFLDAHTEPSPKLSGHMEMPKSPDIELKPLDKSLPEQFIVFDLETTGLYPDRHEIIEIGAIKVQRDSDVHATFQALVRPNKRVPLKIVNLTGITNEMLEQDGILLEEAMREFAAFVGDLPMVAFNARFDKSFLERASAQTGIVISNQISCALEAAKRAWPGRESYKLADLSAAGGLSLVGAHRALADCQRAAIIYTAACRWPDGLVLE